MKLEGEDLVAAHGHPVLGHHIFFYPIGASIVAFGLLQGPLLHEISTRHAFHGVESITAWGRAVIFHHVRTLRFLAPQRGRVDKAFRHDGGRPLETGGR